MIPVCGFIGYSGSGKTTLIEKLLPILKKHFAKIAVIKSTHHHIELDQPGKDSFRYRQSGADSVVLAAPNASLHWRKNETPIEAETLSSIIDSLAPEKLDLILFEGFKTEAYPKIVVYRSDLGEFRRSLLDPYCVAIACDNSANLNNSLESSTISRLNLDEPRQIAEFIQSRITNAQSPSV